MDPADTNRTFYFQVIPLIFRSMSFISCPIQDSARKKETIHRKLAQSNKRFNLIENKSLE